MRNSQSFGSYEQFKREVLRYRTDALNSFVDDIADEMVHNEVQEEFDTLWDARNDDKE